MLKVFHLRPPNFKIVPGSMLHWREAKQTYRVALAGRCRPLCAVFWHSAEIACSKQVRAARPLCIDKRYDHPVSGKSLFILWITGPRSSVRPSLTRAWWLSATGYVAVLEPPPGRGGRQWLRSLPRRVPDEKSNDKR